MNMCLSHPHNYVHLKYPRDNQDCHCSATLYRCKCRHRIAICRANRLRTHLVFVLVLVQQCAYIFRRRNSENIKKVRKRMLIKYFRNESENQKTHRNKSVRNTYDSLLHRNDHVDNLLDHRSDVQSKYRTNPDK